MSSSLWFNSPCRKMLHQWPSSLNTKYGRDLVGCEIYRGQGMMIIFYKKTVLHLFRPTWQLYIYIYTHTHTHTFDHSTQYAGILVPCPGIEPMCPALEAPNHSPWTPGKSPTWQFWTFSIVAPWWKQFSPCFLEILDVFFQLRLCQEASTHFHVFKTISEKVWNRDW